MALGILLSAIPFIGRAQTTIYSDSFETDALNSTAPAGWLFTPTGVSTGGGYVCVQGAASFSGTYSGLNGAHALYLFLQGLSGQTATFQGIRFYNTSIGQTFAANTTYKLSYLYGVNGGGPTTISLMGNGSLIPSGKQTITGGTTALVSGPMVTVDTAANPELVGQTIGIDINWSPYTGLYFRSVGLDNIQVTATPDIAKVSMGINAGVPGLFVDLVKNQGQGVFLDPNLARDAGGNFILTPLDANGWPTQDFSINLGGNGHRLATTNPLDIEVGGTYLFSFQCANPSPLIVGKPNQVTVSGFTATADGMGQYLITASVYLPPLPPKADGTPSNSLAMKITNTTQGAISGARNLKVIPPGYPANTTQVFRTDYLSLLAPFSLIRTMDLARANGTPDFPAYTTWADRTPPNFATPMGVSKPNAGVPWEYLVLLANTVNEDLWINVPIAANDDYVTKLAQLIKYGTDTAGNVYTSTQANPVHPPLKSNLHLYVEYSNEVWNDFMDQSAWNVSAAQTEYTNGTSPVTAPANLKPLGSSDFSGTMQPGPANRYAERSVRISNLFASVWGASAMNTTVRPIFAWQLGGGDGPQCAWMQATYGAPKNYLYALAAAPYLGTTRTQQKTNVSPALTPASCITDMDLSLAAQKPFLINLRAGATYYGLKAVTYEGGTGLFGAGDYQAKYDSGYLVGTSTQEGVDTLIKKYYTKYFTEEGGDLNVYYNGIFCARESGYYGLVEHPQDPALATRPLPKWAAINAISAAVRPTSTAGTAIPAIGGPLSNANYLIDLLSLTTSALQTPKGIFPTGNGDGTFYQVFFGPNKSNDLSDPPRVLEYLVNVAAAGTYTIKQSYASTNPQTADRDPNDPTSGPAIIQLAVDNQTYSAVTLTTTPSYNTGFVNAVLGTVTLTKGLHTIHINVIHGATTTHSKVLGLYQLSLTP